MSNCMFFGARNNMQALKNQFNQKKIKINEFVFFRLNIERIFTFFRVFFNTFLVFLTVTIIIKQF